MPQTIIYLDEFLDKEVKEYSEKHKITKQDGVIRLIKLGLKVKGGKNND